MKVAVHQPHYLPWLGYFDKIDRVDVFVILDNVQYKKREYQNRNRIHTNNGVSWLAVPVKTKGRYDQKMSEVEIDDTTLWQEKHFKTLEHNYGHAPHFERYGEFLERVYKGKTWNRLMDLNVEMTKEFLNFLDISVPIVMESDLNIEGASTERIVNICKALGADTYLSGSGGKAYMDESLFEKAGIKLEYHDFKHPEYPQGNGGFEPYLAVVDLLFHCGERSPEILREKRVLS